MPLDTDRQIFDVAEHTKHVTVQKSTRKTANSYDLPMLVHDRPPFTPEEFVRRYDVIQKGMEAMGLDALLIRTPENITYFTGYKTPGYYEYHCIVVPRNGEPVFLVRDFEWINSPEFAWSNKIAKVFDWDHPPSVTANVLRQLGLGDGTRIGVKRQGFFYTVDEHETLVAELPGNEYASSTQILWDARKVKSAEEIAVMTHSAKLFDMAMAAGYEATAPGMSGDQINGIVNKVLFENGGEYMGLPPFVLAGERSCLPHQTGGKNVLKTDDVMYFEISASHKRYTAALMRTIFLGTPRDEWLRCAEACIAAQDKALEVIKPGALPHDVDTAARAEMEKRGFGEYFPNRLGYSIGISYPPDWGEGEIISMRQEEYRPLQPGMTFHMPPMNLTYREYGIGISESIVVTEDGNEVLGKTPREVVIKAGTPFDT